MTWYTSWLVFTLGFIYNTTMTSQYIVKDEQYHPNSFFAYNKYTFQRGLSSFEGFAIVVILLWELHAHNIRANYVVYKVRWMVVIDVQCCCVMGVILWNHNLDIERLSNTSSWPSKSCKFVSAELLLLPSRCFYRCIMWMQHLAHDLDLGFLQIDSNIDHWFRECRFSMTFATLCFFTFQMSIISLAYIQEDG